jgi:hypothetical protein
MKKIHKEEKVVPKTNKEAESFFSPKGIGHFFPSGSDVIQAKAEEGRPLDSQIAQASSTLHGNDFSNVRVHDNAVGDAIAKSHNATAVAFGEDIAFESGAYRPGTSLGDALIAHELAHVAQQRGSLSVSDNESRSSENHLEHHASSSALKAMIVMKLGGSSASETSLPVSAKSPRRFSACSSGSNQIQPPSYLGPHSLETLREINRIIDNTDLLARVIVVGVAVNAGMASPEENIATQGPGQNIEAAAQALQGIPAIRRYRVHQEIGFLLLNHGNDLNGQERAFWQRVQRMFD